MLVHLEINTRGEIMQDMNLDKYSDQEIMAAQLIANKDTNGFTNAQIASEAGIDPRTLYRWLNSEDFIELLNHFAELSMEGFTSELYSQLKKAVRQGSTRAMELALKNRGKLIDKKEVTGNVDITAINGNLSEEVLLQEIEDLKKKIEGSKPNIPQLKEADRY